MAAHKEVLRGVTKKPPHIRRRETPEAVKVAARQAVREALDECVLVRLWYCESCHQECKTMAAHKDYYEPLDVWWLCHVCHADYDLHGIDPKTLKL